MRCFSFFSVAQDVNLDIILQTAEPRCGACKDTHVRCSVRGSDTPLVRWTAKHWYMGGRQMFEHLPQKGPFK